MESHEHANPDKAQHIKINFDVSFFFFCYVIKEFQSTRNPDQNKQLLMKKPIKVLLQSHAFQFCLKI